MVQLLDGKFEAEVLTQQFKSQLDELKTKFNQLPKLGVVMVGDNPASHLYVKRKQEKAKSLSIATQIINLPENVSREALELTIDTFNNDPAIHGILLQLPLPAHLDAVSAVSRINPLKDVDGLCPENTGLFNLNRPYMIPCTPQGCLHLIHLWKNDITGLLAIVIGRSSLVGSPMARLLLNHNATVIQAHQKTQNLKELCQQADIVVVAVGKKDLINVDWIKSGACIIDVGINPNGQDRITGDVDFVSAQKKAGAISPVPGGVGPLTIMFLMANVIKAFKTQLI